MTVIDLQFWRDAEQPESMQLVVRPSGKAWLVREELNGLSEA